MIFQAKFVPHLSNKEPVNVGLNFKLGLNPYTSYTYCAVELNIYLEHFPYCDLECF